LRQSSHRITAAWEFGLLAIEKMRQALERVLVGFELHDAPCLGHADRIRAKFALRPNQSGQRPDRYPYVALTYRQRLARLTEPVLLSSLFFPQKISHNAVAIEITINQDKSENNPITNIAGTGRSRASRSAICPERVRWNSAPSTVRMFGTSLLNCLQLAKCTTKWFPGSQVKFVHAVVQLLRLI
jgi:hypothetical protein